MTGKRQWTKALAVQRCAHEWLGRPGHSDGKVVCCFADWGAQPNLRDARSIIAIPTEKSPGITRRGS
jgi:hypothetical protein